jgi:hypothetical protein
VHYVPRLLISGLPRHNAFTFFHSVPVGRKTVPEGFSEIFRYISFV